MQNMLCLCSDDKTVSILNETGNVLEHNRVSDESVPSDIRVYEVGVMQSSSFLSPLFLLLSFLVDSNLDNPP